MIYLGADHAGYGLKEKVKGWLTKRNILFQDMGNNKLDPKDDYPDFAAKVARKVAMGDFGILFCGSSEGICIAANKVNGIRAVNPATKELARLARQHNDANILCLSGWYHSFRKSKKLIRIFLDTEFTQEPRHVRRIKKIQRLER